MPYRPCLICGEPGPGSYCERHQPRREHAASRKQRGYDEAWLRLSERARRLQPFCSLCGSPDDLTCDHSPAAWERKAKGLPIRLQDVDVLCRPCNSRKGRAKPWGGDPLVRGSEPAGVAKFQSQIGSDR